MDCKIFVSSTFKDMQDERDVIRNEVLPEIVDYALNYGVNMDIVDLRWGIKTDECESSDIASIKILKTCFDEILLCKPFFIGMIGERYGWIPDLNSIKDSIDPSYLEEIKLEEKSVTEYEMDYALTTYNKDSASFVFCIRDELGNEINEEEARVYRVTSEEDKKRLIKLKDKITSRCPNNYFTYSPKMDQKTRHLILHEFRDKLIKYLKKEIDDRFSHLEKPKNEIEKEILYQGALIEQKSSYFEGRKLILNDIDAFLCGNENVLGVYGVSGIGKSSLLSHLISESLNNKEIKTLYFLAGVSNNSNFTYNMIVSFVYQLSKILKVSFDEKYFDNNYVSDNYEEVVNKFYLLLQKASELSKIHIYVDALDQFSFSSEKGILDWLKNYYINSLDNSNIKILFSYVNDNEIEKQIYLKNIKTMELKEITNEDIVLIANGILKKNKKAFQDRCINALLEKKKDGTLCCGNPLYLSLLLQEIINFDADDFKAIRKLQAELGLDDEDAIYTFICNLIDNAPNTLNDEFMVLINKAKFKISSEFIETVLGIISMSRNGIREKDILSIAKLCGIDFEGADYFYFKKIFKLFFRENNGYINFTHKIIDTILKDYYFNKNPILSRNINDMTIEYIDSLDKEDKFKKKEYLYYLRLTDNKEKFSSYLNENLNDVLVIESFFDVYHVFLKNKTSPDEFFLEVFTNINDINSFINNTLMYQDSPKLTLKLFMDLLYKTKLSLNDIITIYYNISDIYFYIEDANKAKHYIAMTNKLIQKYYKINNEIHPLFKEIYLLNKEISLSNKNIVSLLKFIKHWKNVSIFLNNEEMTDYLTTEYLLILKTINYNKAKKLYFKTSISNKDAYEYLSMFFVNDEERIINYVSKINYRKIYENKEIITHLKYVIKDKNSIIKIINILKINLYRLEQDLILNESTKLLRISSYFNSVIAEFNLSINKIEETKELYKKSLDTNHTLTKIEDEANDLYNLAYNKYNLSTINENKDKTYIKDFKKYYKYKKFNIDLSTKVINTFLISVVIIYCLFSYIIIPLIIAKYVDILSHISDIPGFTLLYTCIFNLTEALTFIVTTIMFYQIFNYISLLNSYDPKTLYIKKRIFLYAILSLIANVILCITTNHAYILDYVLILTINFLASIGLMYIINSIENIFKKKSSIERSIISKTHYKKIFIKNISVSLILMMITSFYILILLNMDSIAIYDSTGFGGIGNRIYLFVFTITSSIATFASLVTLIREARKHEI